MEPVRSLLAAPVVDFAGLYRAHAASTLPAIHMV
jgi:hypothetical protein